MFERYTYGLAGAFWLHDTWYREGEWAGFKRKRTMFVVSILTIIAGDFICVAGLYAIITSLIKAYASGAVATPFAC